jgi:putative two-component system response regulator
MKSHTVIGAEIIGQHGAALLRMARSVALTHHEKWDGSGYPKGLAGVAIPLAGRITALADVYDALTNNRLYKPAWSQAQAFDYIRDQAGGHFEPRLASVFLELGPELLEIAATYPDA